VRAAVIRELDGDNSLEHLRRFYSGVVAQADVDAFVAAEAAAGRACSEQEARRLLAQADCVRLHRRLEAEILLVLDLIVDTGAPLPDDGPLAAVLGRSPADLRHATEGVPAVRTRRPAAAGGCASAATEEAAGEEEEEAGEEEKEAPPSALRAPAVGAKRARPGPSPSPPSSTGADSADSSSVRSPRF
jgi:hypothetical protein